MSRVEITVSEQPEEADAAAVELTFTTGDSSSNHYFTYTGREILIARNDDVSAHTVTMKSVADQYGRTGDIAKSIPAGDYYMFPSGRLAAWQQSNGTINVDVDDNNLMLAVLRLPR